MSRKAVFVVLMAAMFTSAHAETDWSHAWAKLWRNADQRGEALLQSGDAAGAAREYADPQRKGHAALKAGDYAGAAQTLSTVDATEAHYNRGNALAYAGDLQGAIKAYDAALKRDPKHQDARHNRDVVAKALEAQQQRQQQQQQQPKKDADASGAPNESKQGDGKDGAQNSPAKNKGDGQSDRAKGKDGANKPDAASGATQNKQPNPQDGRNAPGQTGMGQNNGQQSKSDKQGGPEQGQAPNAKAGQAAQSGTDANPTSADDAEQARRELAAGMQAGKPAQAPAPDSLTPKTEKQIAQEQWLRSIPDDPGGLLRRKFLIEHMIRQQGKQP